MLKYPPITKEVIMFEAYVLIGVFVAFCILKSRKAEASFDYYMSTYLKGTGTKITSVEATITRRVGFTVTVALIITLWLPLTLFLYFCFLKEE